MLYTRRLVTPVPAMGLKLLMPVSVTRGIKMPCEVLLISNIAQSAATASLVFIDTPACEKDKLIVIPKVANKLIKTPKDVDKTEL